MKVRFSSEAEADLQNAVRHIAADSPTNARTLARRIREAADLLRRMPRIGRVGRLDGTREKPAPRTPYILTYEVAENEVVILRILHGHQDWPPPI